MELDIAKFRAQFPVYADTEKYPDELLESLWAQASCYVSPTGYCCVTEDCREQAMFLMLAHLLYLRDFIGTGQAPGMVSSSTVDRVSVTMVPPPSANMRSWWLNLSSWGQQLAALVASCAAGGTYVTTWRGARGLR